MTVRENLVVQTLTFHSGESSLTYPWGIKPETENISPDFKAFDRVAHTLQKVSGASFPKLSMHQYKIGTMNDVVYPCRGPYEDYIYSASWKTKYQVICENFPSRYQKIPKETHRAFVFLLEGGDDKHPPESEYGDSTLWNNQGQVSRNLILLTKFLNLGIPEIKIQKLKKLGDRIDLYFNVRGCIEVENLTMEVKGVSQIFKLSNVPGEHSVTFSTSEIDPLELSVKMTCDSYPGVSGETHYVKMRQTKDYVATNEDYSVGSYFGVEDKIENLKISDKEENWFIGQNGRKMRVRKGDKIFQVVDRENENVGFIDIADINLVLVKLSLQGSKLQDQTIEIPKNEIFELLGKNLCSYFTACTQREGHYIQETDTRMMDMVSYLEFRPFEATKDDFKIIFLKNFITKKFIIDMIIPSNIALKPSEKLVLQVNKDTLLTISSFQSFRYFGLVEQNNFPIGSNLQIKLNNTKTVLSRGILVPITYYQVNEIKKSWPKISEKNQNSKNSKKSETGSSSIKTAAGAKSSSTDSDGRKDQSPLKFIVVVLVVAIFLISGMLLLKCLIQKKYINYRGGEKEVEQQINFDIELPADQV